MPPGRNPWNWDGCRRGLLQKCGARTTLAAEKSKDPSICIPQPAVQSNGGGGRRENHGHVSSVNLDVMKHIKITTHFGKHISGNWGKLIPKPTRTAFPPLSPTPTGQGFPVLLLHFKSSHPSSQPCILYSLAGILLGGVRILQPPEEFYTQNIKFIELILIIYILYIYII